MKTKLIAFILFTTIIIGAIVPAFAAEKRPIFLGYAGTDWMAEEILKKIPLQGKSDKEKAAAIYDWVIQNLSDVDTGTRYFDEQTVSNKASEMMSVYENQVNSGEILLRQNFEFDTMGVYPNDEDYTYFVSKEAGNTFLRWSASNCLSFSYVFTALMSHAGLDCRVVTGSFVSQGQSDSHRWNYALIDGKYYWFDIYRDFLTYKYSKTISHQYFMIADSNQLAKDHVWEHPYYDWLANNVAAVHGGDQPVPTPTLSTTSSWAQKYIDRAIAENILPENYAEANTTVPITREEFAYITTMLYCKLSNQPIPTPASNPFPDTTNPYAAAAYEIGIIKGIDGKFEPNMTLTREQASTMLGRIREIIGIQKTTSELNFSDSSQIAGYAQPYVADLVGAGAIAGVGNGRFAPKQEMTVEQAVKISVEMMD